MSQAVCSASAEASSRQAGRHQATTVQCLHARNMRSCSSSALHSHVALLGPAVLGKLPIMGIHNGVDDLAFKAAGHNPFALLCFDKLQHRLCSRDDRGRSGSSSGGGCIMMAGRRQRGGTSRRLGWAGPPRLPLGLRGRCSLGAGLGVGLGAGLGVGLGCG